METYGIEDIKVGWDDCVMRVCQNPVVLEHFADELTQPNTVVLEVITSSKQEKGTHFYVVAYTSDPRTAEA